MQPPPRTSTPRDVRGPTGQWGLSRKRRMTHRQPVRTTHKRRSEAQQTRPRRAPSKRLLHLLETIERSWLELSPGGSHRQL